MEHSEFAMHMAGAAGEVIPACEMAGSHSCIQDAFLACVGSDGRDFYAG
ncbi:hypothetical protein [Paenibacillus solanacearum]|nr:hypothetical protein [Paenibacillus solanacearum]